MGEERHSDEYESESDDRDDHEAGIASALTGNSEDYSYLDALDDGDPDEGRDSDHYEYGPR